MKLFDEGIESVSMFDGAHEDHDLKSVGFVNGITIALLPFSAKY